MLCVVTFPEFEVLSLLRGTFPFIPTSKHLLAFVTALQLGAWRLLITFVKHWSSQDRLSLQQADSVESLLDNILWALCVISPGLFLFLLKIRTTSVLEIL